MEGPRIRILGIAQDGGLPHAACSCPRCDAARRDPTRASGVASLGIITPTDKKVFLVDATPDIVAQLDILSDVRRYRAGAVDRSPVDGVFLTHAHIGHYLGLAHLGFEAVSVSEMPVWCSASMALFLKGNAPWDRLVSQNHLRLHTVVPGQDVELDDGIRITPFSVPHRAEYTDTFGYTIQGPQKRIVYIPDTSPWHAWKTAVDDVFNNVDVALIDGTFFSADELPGRDISKIGHPLIVDSMDRLQSRVDAGTLEVHFVHLNHSNPALDPNSPERKRLEKRGFHVGRTGKEFAL